MYYQPKQSINNFREISQNSLWFHFISIVWFSQNGSQIWWPLPRCSMYGVFTYIWVVLGVNVGTNAIRWASGLIKSIFIISSLRQLFGGTPSFHSDPRVRLVTLEDWGINSKTRDPTRWAQDPVISGGSWAPINGRKYMGKWSYKF